jgi:predicted  nucleic acid-binding Zn-ribbon protein
LDEKIVRLKELQKIGLALRALELERQQGPLQLATVEEAYNETSATVGAVKHRHDALKAECATLEFEQRDLQQKLVKFQAALMEVKNNKEYSAVLKEIDSSKVEIAKREEALLARMQEMESLQNDLPEVEAKLAVETKAFDEQRAAIQASMASLEQRSEALGADRRKLEAGLPRDILSAFYRVADARQGIAIARITEAVCSACNVRLRLQMFNEIKRGDALLTCDSCRRFLYYEPIETAGPGASVPADSPKP